MYKHALALASLLAIAACFSPNPDRSSEPVATVAITASEGGSLSITTAEHTGLAGLLLEVPAGALEADTTLTADPVADIADAPAGSAVDLGPDGTLFAGGASLTLPLSDTAPLLGLYVQVQEADGTRTTLESPTVDSELRTVTVTIDGFTRFQPGHRTPCEVDADCASGEQCTSALCKKAHNTTTGCTSDAECASGQVCLDGGCHADPTTSPECTVDADCRTYSSYCDGCTCEALPVGANHDTCGGTTVECFADPCMNHTAVCVEGTCATVSTVTSCASDADCPTGEFCYSGACSAG